MGRAYSNDGASFRTSWGTDLGDSEVYFDGIPSEEELSAHFPKYVPLARRALLVSARLALVNSDVSMHRITEAIILGKTTQSAQDVIAFVNYRQALRAIVSGSDTTSTDLPTKPAYPANA